MKLHTYVRWNKEGNKIYFPFLKSLLHLPLRLLFSSSLSLYLSLSLSLTFPEAKIERPIMNFLSPRPNPIRPLKQSSIRPWPGEIPLGLKQRDTSLIICIRRRQERKIADNKSIYVLFIIPQYKHMCSGPLAYLPEEKWY